MARRGGRTSARSAWRGEDWMSVDPNSTSVTLTPPFIGVVKGALGAIKRQLRA